VASHDFGERRGQHRHIEPSRQVHRRRDVVERVVGLQPVEEPEPLLRERQHLQLFQGGLCKVINVIGWIGLIGPIHFRPAGQPFHRRHLEHRPHRQLGPERRADPRDHLRRQQRMPAQRKEVVRGADPLQSEHFGEDRRHLRLGRRARLPAARRFRPLRLRCLERRERLAVHLPAAGQRQGWQEDKGGGDHEIRQALPQTVPQLRLGHRRDDVGHQRGTLRQHRRRGHATLRQ